jgi:hypothetical protein
VAAVLGPVIGAQTLPSPTQRKPPEPGPR